MRFDTELARFMADDLNALAQLQPDDVHSNARLYLESCARSLGGNYGVRVYGSTLLYVERSDKHLTTLLYDVQARTFKATAPSDYIGSN